MSAHLQTNSSTPSTGALAPRDYQQECLDAIHAAEQRDITRQLVALPTGTGKSVVFAHLIHERGGRTLVAVHREELLRQAADKIGTVDPSAHIGLIKAEQDEVDAPVVVASVQTLSRPNRLARLTPDFRTVVVDEAHHATAVSYRAILEHVGSFRPDGPLTVGFTATPERGDGTALGDVFQELVFERDILSMIGQRYLVDLRAIQVRLKTDFGKLHVRAGDFVDREVEQAMLRANAPRYAVQAYQAYATGRKTLLFTPTVSLAHAMAEAFCEAGIAAEALDGGTPGDERRGVLDRLTSGRTRVVANCGILVEGFDEPSVNCIIIARPTRSKPLYIQMLGRGTRTYPGKDDCLVLDLVGSTTRHDLITTADLFGCKPSELTDQTLTEAIARRQAQEQEAADGKLVAKMVDLFRGRPLHWVQTPEGFVLHMKDGWVALEHQGGTWSVARIERNRSRHMLASMLSLGYAQGLAEDLARKEGATALVDPSAAWRQKPVTDKQSDLLTRLGISIRAGLTAGEASDLITASFAGRRSA